MRLASSTLPATAALVASLVAALLGGCSASTGSNEHDRDGGEHGREEGEESGVELALDERFDATRNGVRLVLAYDAGSNSFQGTVRNTTDRSLERVRLEVHLSNGRELGPTTAVNLAPGASQDVSLAAESTDFDRWTAHPEVGSGEHGHGEHDGEGEHD